jgi:glycosyltransferase involved in cell wall biosynthesis
MLLSVILPVKYAANTLMAAVSSILQQTLSDFELIVIDDYSTDGSMGLLKGINDPRIIIIQNKGNGIADALNTGIAHAKGKYIARMDADDISLPERLAKQYQFIIDNPDVDVVSCLVAHKSSNATDQQGYKYHIDWLNSILTVEEHFLNRFTDAPVAHPTVLFKANLPRDFGTYASKALPEDFELWLRWMEKGLRFAKVPEVLFEWSDYPVRTSRTHKNYRMENFYQQKAVYFARWWKSKKINKEIWIWGYGKDVFKKVQPLATEGLKITGFIDISERPKAKRRVRSFKSILPHANEFYLIYVADRDGKTAIVDYLSQLALTNGEDYLIMA